MFEKCTSSMRPFLYWMPNSYQSFLTVEMAFSLIMLHQFASNTAFFHPALHQIITTPLIVNLRWRGRFMRRVSRLRLRLRKKKLYLVQVSQPWFMKPGNHETSVPLLWQPQLFSRFTNSFTAFYLPPMTNSLWQHGGGRRYSHDNGSPSFAILPVE